MNKRRDGFGVIEILLIIIVVSVLGATGWYALHTKHQTDQILAQSEKISKSSPTTIKSKSPTSSNSSSSGIDDGLSKLSGKVIQSGVNDNGYVYVVAERGTNKNIDVVVTEQPACDPTAKASPQFNQGNGVNIVAYDLGGGEYEVCAKGTYIKPISN